RIFYLRDAFQFVFGVLAVQKYRSIVASHLQNQMSGLASCKHNVGMSACACRLDFVHPIFGTKDIMLT
ncbi:hypothetical protein, partial [Enterobacter kobei]